MSTNKQGVLATMAAGAALGMVTATAAVMNQQALLQPGDIAPDFSATATDGGTIHLADLVGSKYVVLFFYPRDFTGGCTREVCEFRDAKHDFDSVNAAVYGLSTDDQEAHKGFTAKHELNFPLLVDTDQKICGLYGVPVHETMAKRVTFLIGLDGKIARVWDHVNPTGHAAEVAGAIRELIAQSK